MYGSCGICKSARIDFLCEHASDTESCAECRDGKIKLKRFDSNQVVSCFQWVSKVEKFEDKSSTIVVKENEEQSLFDLVERFHDYLSRIRKHVYNIQHQYQSYRQLRSKLSDHDCIIQIDFSENYLCRYSREIQATHFGGSHKQATLQTGILYVGQQEPKSFCTISNSRIHEPIAIWEYLKPVLADLKREHPNITTLHFFTDGPVTQYRQKKNFFLFSTLLNNCYTVVTWNFWEASHGKGPADGIGAVLKRTADKLVREGTDIASPEAMFASLQSKTTVKLYFVEHSVVSHAICSNSDLSNLPSVPGTMMLHQVIVNCTFPGTIKYRDVSCFCSEPSTICTCYDTKSFTFIEQQVQNAATLEAVVEKTVKFGATLDQLDQTLIGQHCIVTYDGKPYPGKIISLDENEVEVDCMHAVPTKRDSDSNVFYWPTPVRDLCFYQFHQLITLIPEPRKLAECGRLSKHFAVDASIWREVKSRFS